MISDIEYNQLVNAPKGRTFLEDIIEREFEANTQLSSEFYLRLSNKIKRILMLSISALGFAILLLKISPWCVLIIILLISFTNNRLDAVFFNDKVNGIPSLSINKEVKRIKITHARALSIRTLSGNEIEEYLSTLPANVAEIARVLIGDAGYKTIDEVITAAEKLCL